jgi:mannitol/fructose-specific phosphotransferase system IIA component (Ntr-type)
MRSAVVRGAQRGGVGNVKLTEYLEAELVVFDIQPGEVADILSQLIDPLVRDGTLGSSERVLEALLAREKVLSTGIGQGIAVPHAISEVIQSPQLIVGLAPHGVDYHSMDDAPVNVFFVLLSPPDRAGHHIRLLARIARLARHPEFVDALRLCETGEQVVSHIHEYEQEHV